MWKYPFKHPNVKNGVICSLFSEVKSPCVLQLEKKWILSESSLLEC